MTPMTRAWYDDDIISISKSPHASTLDMSDEDKARAKTREERVASEGFGFARALFEDPPRRSLWKKLRRSP